MRALAIVLIVLGLGGGFFYPAVVARHSGDVIAAATVFERGNGGWQRGWKAAALRLDPSRNPMRIVVEADFLSGNKFLKTTTGIAMSLSSGGAVVLEGSFDLSLPVGNASELAPRQASFVTPEFDIVEAGDYVLSVRSEESIDMSFKSASATVRGSVEKPDESLRMPSYAALGTGLFLFFISALWRRRKTSETPGEHWGRDV